MYFNPVAFLFSAGAVVLAEMGDKTQLLAMAFATKYKASKVLIGVFIATVLNHGLAVAVGNYLTRFESAQVWIQAIASLSFIFFGLWTIRGDELDGEENKTTKYGAVATVAFAFFLAEMGDKTQLATIALATKFGTSPLGILMGTTAGMMIADGIGIVLGLVLCKKIPEQKIKFISASIFILFGFIGCIEVAYRELQFGFLTILVIATILAALTYIAAWYLIKSNNTNETKDII
ncbi:MAG: TMEM165/GDT1 family protein [Clostridiales bacterium]|nr:TMEM165/GDT1 family protein [Clostridiales bacterium]